MGQKYQIYSACDGEEHIYWRQQDSRQGILRQQIVTLGFKTRIFLRMTLTMGRKTFNWSSSPQGWDDPHTGTWT